MSSLGIDQKLLKEANNLLLQEQNKICRHGHDGHDAHLITEKLVSYVLDQAR